MLRCHQLMVVEYAVEGAVDPIVQIVHHSVQLAGRIAHLALGMNLADQCICGGHKEATRLGDYLNALIGKMPLYGAIHIGSYLELHFV